MGIKKLKRSPNQLKKFRKGRGLSQAEVAKILGLKSSSIISRWENGRGIPGSQTMFKLAILYRTMADGLFIDLRRSLLEEMRKSEERVLNKQKSKK